MTVARFPRKSMAQSRPRDATPGKSECSHRSLALPPSSGRMTVMLVIRTSDKTIRWMNVTECMKGHGGKNVTQIVFEGEPFTALSLLRMRYRLIPLPD